jgi:hypothetical protein
MDFIKHFSDIRFQKVENEKFTYFGEKILMSSWLYYSRE